MTLYEIFYFLFRNKWLIIVGILSGAIAAGAVFMLKPREYRSDAKLLVRYVSDTVIVDPAMSGERVLTPGRPSDSVIGTEVDILSSAELVIAAAKALTDAAGAKTNRVAVPMTAREIGKNFRVQVAKNSSTILVSLDGPSPESTQQALGELIKAYLIKHQEVHKDPGVFEFISRQTDEMRTRVNNTEDELRRVKNQAGITSFADSRALVQARIQDLDRAMREREGVLVATRARMQILTNQIARESVALPGGAVTGLTTRTAVVVPPEVRDAYRRLIGLYRQEAELLRVYTTNSVPVVSVREQIDRIRSESGFKAFVDVATNSVEGTATAVRSRAEVFANELAGYRAEEAAALAQLELMKKEMEQAQADSKRVEGSEAEIARLERTREIYDTNYRYFSQRLERARVDSAMDASKVSNIALVQPPTYPDRPLTRELWKLLGMVLAAGAVCGVALAFTREYVLDHSIRHPYTIPRALNVPLLAVLPRLRRPARQRRLDNPASANMSGEAAAVQAWLASCEVIGHIVQHVANRQEGQTLRIGVIAPHHGAGVTFIADKIAEAIHLSGSKSVLLATVSGEGMLAAKEVGVASTDVEAEEVMAKPPRPGRDAEEWIPVRIPFSAPAPMTPRLMAELLRQEHDIILYDLPPPNVSEYAVRLLPQLHGVILVAETFRTTFSEAHAVIGLVQQLQCPVYGVVLNKFASPLSNRISPPQTPPAAPPPLAALPSTSTSHQEQAS